MPKLKKKLKKNYSVPRIVRVARIHCLKWFDEMWIYGVVNGKTHRRRLKNIFFFWHAHLPLAGWDWTTAPWQSHNVCVGANTGALHWPVDALLFDAFFARFFKGTFCFPKIFPTLSDLLVCYGKQHASTQIISCCCFAVFCYLKKQNILPNRFFRLLVVHLNHFWSLRNVFCFVLFWFLKSSFGCLFVCCA